VGPFYFPPLQEISGIADRLEPGHAHVLQICIYIFGCVLTISKFSGDIKTVDVDDGLLLFFSFGMDLAKEESQDLGLLTCS
jgi:hypothetical protein